MSSKGTPRNRKDITNQRFGMLKAIKIDSVRKNQAFWQCHCDCGNDCVVRISHLTQHLTTSCGCRENANQEVIHSRIEPYLTNGTNTALVKSEKIYATNKSGVRGVHYNNRDGRWVAKITFRGVSQRAYFPKFEDAVKWRKNKEAELFGPYKK